jgi:hypothetical protein
MHRARVLRFICIPIFVLFLLLLAGPVQGQAAPDSGSGSAPTSFVKSVDEVSIDFAIRNQKKLLPNLKPEDVVVTDDGSVVKLADLRLVTGKSGANHLITLLFDPLDPSAATNARDVVKKILKLIPVNEFSFSVFNTEQRLRLFQEFTTDREKIQQAINAATSDSSSRDQSAVLAEKRLISAVQSGIGQGLSRAPANDRAVEKAVLASLTESRRIVQISTRQRRLPDFWLWSTPKLRFQDENSLFILPKGCSRMRTNEIRCAPLPERQIAPRSVFMSSTRPQSTPG